MSSWQIAALAFAPFAAWYVQWLVRWASGPFGILDIVRQAVFGVAILEDAGGKSYHQPIRSRWCGVGLMECSRCMLFWVGVPITVLIWGVPLVVIALGIMGSASLLDDRVK